MSLHNGYNSRREVIDLVSDEETPPILSRRVDPEVDYVDLVEDNLSHATSGEPQVPDTPVSGFFVDEGDAAYEPYSSINTRNLPNSDPDDADLEWLPQDHAPDFQGHEFAPKRPRLYSSERTAHEEEPIEIIASSPVPTNGSSRHNVLEIDDGVQILETPDRKTSPHNTGFPAEHRLENDLFLLDPAQMSRKERNSRFKETLKAMTELERSAAVSFRAELDSFCIGLVDKADELLGVSEGSNLALYRGVYRDLSDKYRLLSKEAREVYYDLQLRRYSEASVLEFIGISRERIREKNKRLQKTLHNLQASLYERPAAPRVRPAPLPESGSSSSQVVLSESARVEMENAYENLLDKIHNNVTPMPMPEELDVSNLEHQRLGLGWLVSVEKGPNHGGILADDMGLGKTIQSIALIYANPPPPESEAKLTLIVCSTALIQTWFSELNDRVYPHYRKRVYIHHRATNSNIIMNKNLIESHYDVVITTYHTLLYETDAQAKRQSRPMPSIHWWRIILDEAHTIKNHAARTSMACASLRANNRICLTGTPMQNNLIEIWPLLRFLRIAPYWDDMNKFKSILPVEKVTMNNASRESTHLSDTTRDGAQFKTLLQMILLRRRKTTKINGRKILEGLPSKTTYRVLIKMNSEEMAMYKERESSLIAGVRSRIGSISVSNILASLLRMRQQACHPLLIEVTGILLDRPEFRVSEEDVQAAIHMRDDSRAQNIADSLTEVNCTNCFSVDPADEGSVLVISSCCHTICRSCFESLDSETEGPFPRCPSCNGYMRQKTPLRVLRDVLKKRDFSADELTELFKDQYQRSRKRNRGQAQEWQQRVGMLVEALEDRIESLDVDEDSKYLIRGFQVVNRGIGQPEDSTEEDGGDEEDDVNHYRTISVLSSAECDRKIKYALNVDEVARLFRAPTVFSEGWKSSAKIDTCMALLDEIWESNPTDKVIIFSSFTSFLELFTIPFTAARIPFAMYTGAMAVEERTQALDSFKNGAERVLLISLKAGNVGLTLTSANRVILAEPFWNPYVEDQAKDRVHRIGQAKGVYVYRLFNNETVEGRIQEIQEKKRRIIGKALDSKPTNGAQVTRQDLLYMLGLGGPT